MNSPEAVLPTRNWAEDPMKAAFLLPLAIALATPAPPALAQSADDKMKKLVAEQADEGAKLIGEIVTGKLKEDEDVSFDFAIERGKTYWVYGACDSNCDDIDLEGANVRGDVLDADDERDDADPVLLVSDRSATRLKVTVSMKDCVRATCAFGIGLYEQALVWPGGPPKQ
jgi:hypothetical protein